MCYYIGIQDLAANALIDIMDREQGRTVSFKALNEYGIAVVRKLVNEKQEAILLFSREHVFGMMHECSNLFEVHHVGEPDASITLRDGVTKDDLANRFYGSIPLEVLKAMIDEESLAALEKAA